jgi:hypothetical protein
LQREIAKLEGNLSTAQNKIQNAESAANKVITLKYLDMLAILQGKMHTGIR